MRPLLGVGRATRACAWRAAHEVTGSNVRGPVLGGGQEERILGGAHDRRTVRCRRTSDRILPGILLSLAVAYAGVGCFSPHSFFLLRSASDYACLLVAPSLLSGDGVAVPTVAAHYEKRLQQPLDAASTIMGQVL
jgi:hypothetical protein